ncbi:MAG: hypothetical protein R3E99_09090 [Burkholderiaceae bacterium]
MNPKTDTRSPQVQASTTRSVRRLRIVFWLIQALWLGAALTLGARSAGAQETWPPATDSHKDQAVAAQVADVGTTGIGLAMGAAEANPLGILTLGMKVVAYQQIKEAPPVEQPRLWSAYGAMGWGAAANNLCVIATLATGGAGAVLCPAIGLAAGLGVWNQDAESRDKATFAALCTQAQATNPDLTCVWNPA